MSYKTYLKFGPTDALGRAEIVSTLFQRPVGEMSVNGFVVTVPTPDHGHRVTEEFSSTFLREGGEGFFFQDGVVKKKPEVFLRVVPLNGPAAVRPGTGSGRPENPFPNGVAVTVEVVNFPREWGKVAVECNGEVQHLPPRGPLDESFNFAVTWSDGVAVVRVVDPFIRCDPLILRFGT